MNQRICVLAFNFFNQIAPSNMSDIFIPNIVVRNTRNSHHSFKIPFRKTNVGQNALSYSGPDLWNKIPIDIKLAKTRNDFKHKIKSNYFETLNHNYLITRLADTTLC